MLRIKYERLKRGLSQKAAGKKSHVPQPAFGLIETGRLKPLPSQLQRLAAAFGVPPEELLKPVEIVEERTPIAMVEEQTA